MVPHSCGQSICRAHYLTVGEFQRIGALSLGPLSRQAQDEKPKCAGSETGKKHSDDVSNCTWRDNAASTPPPPRACCFAEVAGRD